MIFAPDQPGRIFFSRRYSVNIEFSAAPVHIDIINLEALPITYSVCCVFVEVADNSTTHNTVIFVLGERLSFS